MKKQRSLRGKIWERRALGGDFKAAIQAERQGQTSRQVWLKPSFSDLADPRLMPGVKTACDRLQQAINLGERVMVYGDFDCDGITATALMVHGLTQLGAEVSYRIPDRVNDSHGLKPYLIDEAVAAGCKLLITVDCGVNDRAVVAYALEQGLEVIVTDHHLVDPARLVDQAVAVVNPKLVSPHPKIKHLAASGSRDSESPPHDLSNLAGVGVAFKLLQALKPDEAWLQPYLALAAIGTVADCVPLCEESRTLVQLGLQALNKHPWPGVTSLLRSQNEITAETIGFELAPCLNAASRLGQVQHAVQLFLGDQAQMADRVAYLQQLNHERKALTLEFTHEAQDLVNQRARAQIIFLEACPVGILGLVASRLSDSLGQPVLCLTRHPHGALHGSARAPKGSALSEVLETCSGLLTQFGGHDGAAGFRLKESDLAEFIHCIQTHYASQPVMAPTLQVEALLEPAELNHPLLQWQNTLAPFGMSNPQPVWQLSGLELTDLQLMGADGNHARLTFAAQHEAVAFNVTDLLPHLKTGQSYDLAITLNANHWNGETKLQWQLVDIRRLGSPS